MINIRKIPTVAAVMAKKIEKTNAARLLDRAGGCQEGRDALYESSSK